MWMVANPRIYCLSTLMAFLGLTWFGAYLHAASEQEASKGDAVRRLSADEIASRAASATYYPQKDVRMDV